MTENVNHLNRYIAWYDEVVIPGYERAVAKRKKGSKHALHLSIEYRRDLQCRLDNVTLGLDQPTLANGGLTIDAMGHLKSVVSRVMVDTPEEITEDVDKVS